jgi:hypothetical protein
MSDHPEMEHILDAALYQEALRIAQETRKIAEDLQREVDSSLVQWSASLDREAVLASQRDAMADQLNQIRIALEQVAVYQGMGMAAALPLHVSELVRDHEEMERRIEGALVLISTADIEDRLKQGLMALLQTGESWVPDFPEDEIFGS